MNRRNQLQLATPQPIHSLSRLAGHLRRTVGNRLMRDFGVRLSPALIRRVLDEAMETAQETGFPTLFFPVVAEEKARLALAALGQSKPQTSSQNLRHAA
jgi:hypothetical protein